MISPLFNLEVVYPESPPPSKKRERNTFTWLLGFNNNDNIYISLTYFVWMRLAELRILSFKKDNLIWCSYIHVWCLPWHLCGPWKTLPYRILFICIILQFFFIFSEWTTYINEDRITHMMFCVCVSLAKYIFSLKKR